MSDVLRLDAAGVPCAWVSPNNAARLYVLGYVLWTLGQPFRRLHGGLCAATGTQSLLDLHPIVATRGIQARIYDKHVPRLSRRSVYRRDHGLCMYCGEHVPYSEATLDHVIPRSHGGTLSYMNVVLAHRRCNAHKGARTPEEAGMQLVAAPFVPSRIEDLILAAGHTILADQMKYLASKAGHKHALCW